MVSTEDELLSHNLKIPPFLRASKQLCSNGLLSLLLEHDNIQGRGWAIFSDV